MKVKLSYLLSNVYIFFLIIYSFLNVIIYGTTIEDYNKLFYVINEVLVIIWLVFRMFILIKIVIQFEKRDFWVVLLLIIGILITFFSKSGWVSEAIWLICGTKRVDMRKLIKHLLCAHIIGITIILGGFATGVLRDNVVMRGTMARHSYGFNHPNALGARILEISLMYIYIRNHRLNKFDMIMTATLAIVTYLLTNSITSSGLMLMEAFFILLIENIEKSKGLLKRISKTIINKVKWAFWLIPILATVVIVFSDIFKEKLSGTILSRILQARYYYEYYGLSVFGRQLISNNSADNFQLQISKLYTLDNGYMYLLLGYGVIIFLLFVLGNIILAKKMMILKEYSIVLIIAIYAVYGFAETMMIRFTYNFSVLFFSYIIWDSKYYKCMLRKSSKYSILGKKYI